MRYVAWNEKTTTPVFPSDEKNIVPKAALAESISQKVMDTALRVGTGSDANFAATRGMKKVPSARSLAEQLFDSRAIFKQTASPYSMHLPDGWRGRLFAQIDSMLDSDEWDADDRLIARESYVTFFKLITLRGIHIRPAIANSGTGNIIATWRDGNSSLVIECKPHSIARWILSIEGGEKNAGEAPVALLLDRLSGYKPERWFDVG